MKQNLLALLLLIALGVIAYGHLFQLTPRAFAQTDTSGRYQIISATRMVVLRSGKFTEATVYKLDTQTGKAWIYIAGQDDKGINYSAWLPITE